MKAHTRLAPVGQPNDAAPALAPWSAERLHLALAALFAIVLAMVAHCRAARARRAHLARDTATLPEVPDLAPAGGVDEHALEGLAGFERDELHLDLGEPIGLAFGTARDEHDAPPRPGPIAGGSRLEAIEVQVQTVATVIRALAPLAEGAARAAEERADTAAEHDRVIALWAMFHGLRMLAALPERDGDEAAAMFDFASLAEPEPHAAPAGPRAYRDAAERLALTDEHDLEADATAREIAAAMALADGIPPGVVSLVLAKPAAERSAVAWFREMVRGAVANDAARGAA